MTNPRKVGHVGWKNRIVRSGVQRADQFLAHPDNWRKHPSAQEEALVAILDSVGWVQEVIVSKRTGYMIDGHLRVAAAIRKGDETPVPFKEVEVTEHEEAMLLASMDPLSALAVTDQLKYDELIGILPEHYADMAALARGSKETAEQLVQFTAKAKHNVVVECQDEHAQQALMAKLREEGYVCRGSK